MRISGRLSRACLLVLTLGMMPLRQPVPVEIERVPLSKTQVCSGQFVAHDLDHVTTVPGGDDVRMFEANGSGVGINDLDNDGDQDIGLANHAGQNTILWNDGDLSFRTQRLGQGDSRGVNLIDLDGDDRVDLFFTRTKSAPNFWHNAGDGVFTLEVLNGLAEPLYATNWGDLDGDGDLDLVGGSYDAALLVDLGQEFLTNGRGGVYYYENRSQSLSPMRLVGEAQALTLVLVDLNDDQRLDILVGNDFAVPDYVWLRTDTGWALSRPFATTSYSTMSYDAADVDNNGVSELFSTDMKPYETDATELAAWEPALDSGSNSTDARARAQHPANALQVLDGGQFGDVAVSHGVEATGWSWSGKFGDLDQDGFLDLYVVNGMIEFTTFAHLADHELVESNQAFRNDGSGQFVSAPGWNLGSKRSGRGMSMADMDGDGDLDIVVNNLRSAAQVFENRLCEGYALLVDLRWPGSGNTRAVGARLRLHTDSGTQYRDVRVASGYLSSDPAQIHFGFARQAVLQSLEIEWPDGTLTQVDDLTPQSHLIITRQAA